MSVEQTYQFVVSTDTLPAEPFESFIEALAAMLLAQGVLVVHLIFGWDGALAEEKQIIDRDAEVGLLAATLKDIIRSGFSFGQVDVWIVGKDFEFQFCNDRDLHFRSNHRVLVEAMITLWKAKGFAVYEEGVAL